MTDALQRRLADLERVTIPALRTAASADELDRLSETTREDFGLIERSLEVRATSPLRRSRAQVLSLLAEECTREQDRQAALAEVGTFRRQLDSCVGATPWPAEPAANAKPTGRPRSRPSVASTASVRPRTVPTCSAAHRRKPRRRSRRRPRPVTTRSCRRRRT